MKASKTALVAVLALGSLGLAAGSVSACGGGGGGYKHGGGYGGYNNYHNKVYVKKVYVRPVHVHVEPVCHPFHCFAIVNPGDTWFTLSLREYGKPHLWKKIAIFNGLPLSAGLVPGMQLKLPVIYPNGALLPSSAPAPIAFAGPAPGGLTAPGGVPAGGFPQGAPIGPQANFSAPQGATRIAPTFGAPSQGAPNGALSLNMSQGNGLIMPNMTQPKLADATANFPTANIRTVALETVATEKRLPSVAIGSILSLDVMSQAGQSLGTSRGTVRLKVNGLALPIEVLEWNAEVVKIQLPQIELAGAMKAEIEVLRADGSVASKSAVELTPAATRLALGN